MKITEKELSKNLKVKKLKGPTSMPRNGLLLFNTHFIPPVGRARCICGYYKVPNIYSNYKVLRKVFIEKAILTLGDRFCKGQQYDKR